MGKKRRRPAGTVDSSRSGSSGAGAVGSVSIGIILLLVIGGTLVWSKGAASGQPSASQPRRSPARRLSPGGHAPAASSAAKTSREPVIYKYKVVRELPHDPDAFTQGIEYDSVCQKAAGSGKETCEDVFWESTGLNGESSLREVDLETGRVKRKKVLAHEDFAEGITKFGNRLIQLTWQRPTTFSYAADNFDDVKRLQSPLQDGWGICTDGSSLIVSDSSPVLTWLHPQTLKKQRTVTVHDGDQKIRWVNELEWINGEIWGNVWQTECIARINPADGAVVGWILLQGLGRGERDRYPDHRIDVLNGIAYDDRGKRLFVTGKWWHHLYQLNVSVTNTPTVKLARQFCIPSTFD